MSRVIATCEALSEWTGRAVAWLTLAMVIVTFAVVVLRRMDVGWIAMQETVTWMHGIVFMLGMAYALKHEAHVHVDVFYRDWTPMLRAVVDLIGTLLLLVPLAGFILWSSWDYVADAWSIRERSREAGGLPGLYLLKTVIPVTAVLLLVQGTSIVLRAIATLRGSR